jgi:hypothetical protein
MINASAPCSLAGLKNRRPPAPAPFWSVLNTTQMCDALVYLAVDDGMPALSKKRILLKFCLILKIHYSEEKMHPGVLKLARSTLAKF